MSASHQPQAPAASLNWIRTGPQGAERIVLIHSLGLDLTYWDRQIEALSPTYDVVAFDLPGHGRSSAPPQNWSFDQAASRVAALIEEIGPEPAHLIGVSVGGMIAQALVLARPELVRSMTLIATASTFPEPVRAIMREHRDVVKRDGMAAVLPTLAFWLTAETMTQRPHLIDRITKTVLGNDAAVYADMWTMIADLNIIDRLGEITCPTLLMVCEGDHNTPPACSAAMAERMQNARLIVLPNGAHIAPLEASDAINAAILDFLAA